MPMIVSECCVLYSLYLLHALLLPPTDPLPNAGNNKRGGSVMGVVDIDEDSDLSVQEQVRAA